MLKVLTVMRMQSDEKDIKYVNTINSGVAEVIRMGGVHKNRKNLNSREASICWTKAQCLNRGLTPPPTY